MRPEDVVDYCGGCSAYRCICPKKRTNRFIDRIQIHKIKARKYITKIYGELDSQDFKKLKEYLGTGGSLHKDHFEVRGTMAVKTIDVLEKIGYVISSDLKKQILQRIETKHNKEFQPSNNN